MVRGKIRFPQLVLILMSIRIIYLQARLTVTNFKDAYGLFQDVWAPIAEVLISVSLSLILGKFYWIHGNFVRFYNGRFVSKNMLATLLFV